MNISFVFPQTLGNARRFLVNEMLSAAAKQQGHNVVAANQADFVVLFDNAIPQEAAGKQGAILDLEQAFAQPGSQSQTSGRKCTNFCKCYRNHCGFSGFIWCEKYRCCYRLPNWRGSYFYVCGSNRKLCQSTGLEHQG